jgi:elongation factor Ts
MKTNEPTIKKIRFMAVTMADIAHLRKMSGAGMMDCKKALEEADSDFEKAMEIIRKKGQAVAAKRSDRDASEGCVLAADKEDFAAVVALKCETDFVAKNADFVALTQDILDVAISKRPATLADLLATPLANGRSVENLITERIGVTGEKMELGFYEYVTGAATVSYIHLGSKLATIAAFNQPLERQVARDVAMQIAAMNPVSVTPDEVPQNVVNTELEIARDKARQAGKPENLSDRIAEGALQKFYKDSTLLQQGFIKDQSITVQQYLQQQDKALTVTTFKRVSLNVE